MSKSLRINLVNAREISSFFDMESESPAIATILRLLYEVGLSAVTFPDCEESCDILNYEINIESFFKKNPADIIGFSCWTSGYGIAVDMASVARRVCSNAIIVAGGPHFSSTDEIATALQRGEFDIIFRGGATAFVDFCNSISKGELSVTRLPQGIAINGNCPKDGLCYIDTNGKIIIGNRGKLKGAVSPVIEINDIYADVRVIIKDICPNRCDYCVIEPSDQTGSSLDKLMSYCGSYCEFIKQEINMPIRFALADSAPFVNSGLLKKHLDKFLKLAPEASFSLFADPQDINDNMFEIIEKYRVTSLFFGRDRVVNDGMLGRRFRGKLRSQDMLDGERDKIDSLIDFVSSLKNRKNFEIYLGYILSPFEKNCDSIKMFDEIKYFSLLDYPDSGPVIQSNLFVLNPYPGTAIAECFIDKYIPMRYFRHPYPNVWSHKDAVHPQIELTRLILSKLLCINSAKELFEPFLDFVHNIQHENTANISFASKIYDKDLRLLAQYVMENIAAMDFVYEPADDKYGENIINMHLLGCMMLVMLKNRDWLKKGIFDRVKAAIRDNDGILPLLKKDIFLLKQYAKNKISLN